MRKYLLFIFIIGFIMMLASCSITESVTSDLELNGYDVIKDEEQLEDAYTSYTVYDHQMVVAYIYEFSTFRQARDYYEEQDYEHMTTDLTWIIHNHLIVGAYNQQVINVIVN